MADVNVASTDTLSVGCVSTRRLRGDISLWDSSSVLALGAWQDVTAGIPWTALTYVNTYIASGSELLSLDIAISEAASNYINFSSSDSINTAVVEALNLLEVDFSSADTLDLSISDLPNTLLVSFATSVDSLDVAVTEVSEMIVVWAKTDSLDVAVSDVVNHLYKYGISASDIISIGITDTADLNTLMIRYIKGSFDRISTAKGESEYISRVKGEFTSTISLTGSKT